jgi:hypothetical protein
VGIEDFVLAGGSWVGGRLWTAGLFVFCCHVPVVVVSTSREKRGEECLTPRRVALAALLAFVLDFPGLGPRIEIVSKVLFL